MERNECFTYQFSLDDYNLNKDFYDSIRISYPQTHICYVLTEFGYKVGKIGFPFIYEKYCHQEFPVSIPVKWEYKNDEPT